MSIETIIMPKRSSENLGPAHCWAVIFVGNNDIASTAASRKNVKRQLSAISNTSFTYLNVLTGSESKAMPQSNSLSVNHPAEDASNDPLDTPKHHDLIYDIGMHKGEDTDFYLRKGFRVVAFEANPDLVRCCRARFKSFIEGRQLIIVEGAILDPKALAPGQKTVQFFVSKSNSVWGTVCLDWANRNERMGDSSTTVEVEVTDLTAVLKTHGIPHYMKIDIEGCDMACVNALTRFRERPDYISVETEKTSFQNIQRQIDALVELGYDGFRAVEQSKIHCSQSPPCPPTEGSYVAHQFEQGSSGLFGSELGEQWKSQDCILRHYRTVSLAYRLLGDDGIMTHWKSSAGRLLRLLTRNALKLATREVVPGWHDTHARHASAKPKNT
jgi:FkbM family methyltransferase